MLARNHLPKIAVKFFLGVKATVVNEIYGINALCLTLSLLVLRSVIYGVFLMDLLKHSNLEMWVTNIAIMLLVHSAS